MNSEFDENFDAKKIKAYIAELKPSFAGRFFFYCLPYRKRIVLTNMQRVFADQLTSAEIHKLALAFYSHLARCLSENILAKFMTLRQIQRRAIVRGQDHIIKACDPGRGAIVLTGHFGNWEFAPIAGILNFRQYQGRLYFVRKRLKWAWLEKILFRRYSAVGLGVIPKDNSLNVITETLQKNNSVLFIMDQHASSVGNNAIVVDFLGHQAATHRGLATLVRHLQVPVVPATSYRQADGKHVLEFFPPLQWREYATTRETLISNTRNYNATLESLLLAHPDQWLWTHKRWKACKGFYDCNSSNPTLSHT